MCDHTSKNTRNKNSIGAHTHAHTHIANADAKLNFISKLAYLCCMAAHVCAQPNGVLCMKPERESGPEIVLLPPVTSGGGDAERALKSTIRSNTIIYNEECHHRFSHCH